MQMQSQHSLPCMKKFLFFWNVSISVTENMSEHTICLISLGLKTMTFISDGHVSELLLRDTTPSVQRIIMAVSL